MTSYTMQLAAICFVCGLNSKYLSMASQTFDTGSDSPEFSKQAKELIMCLKPDEEKKKPECNLLFNTIDERRGSGTLVYWQLFCWKMKCAPSNIHHFCDPVMAKEKRKLLTKWIRDIDDRTSCQCLQILFSFSIPSPVAVEKIMALGAPIISAGAGSGYWEYILHSRGVDVIAFDKNDVFPDESRYMEIQTGGPSLVKPHANRALMLSWPDHKDDCTFSVDCLEHYKGDTVIHIGELYGETFSTNPWGQTTSRDFQLRLGEQFRCISRVQLPNWPGYMDSLTVWKKAADSVDCDGADMRFVPYESRRYYGLEQKQQCC